MPEKGCAGGRRRMRKFRINELAAVDSPAQEPALAVLMKRDFSAEQRKQLAEEGKALPDGSFPIVTRGDLSNAIQAFGRAGNQGRAARHIKARAKALGAEDMLPDEGLLSKAADSADNQGGTTMPDPKDQTKELEAVQKEKEELAKKLARAESINQLPADQRAHFDKLDEEGQDEFLSMTKAKRKSTVEKAAKEADDPVVYTDADGIEYRKSDDPRLIAGAKRNDLLAKKLADSEASRENDRIEKRAKEELPNYPGETSIHAEIVRAVEGIEDEETRKAAFAAIKAGNEALGKSFVEIGGHDNRVEVGGPEAQLDKLAKDYAKANKVSEPEAYAKVLETEEGQRLYAEYTGDNQVN